MAAPHAGGLAGGPAPPGEGRSEAGGPGAPRSAPRVAPSPGSSYPGGGGRGAGRRRAGPAGSAEGGAAPLLCVTHPARAAASSILWRWRRAGKASGHLFTRAPAPSPRRHPPTVPARPRVAASGAQGEAAGRLLPHASPDRSLPRPQPAQRGCAHEDKS
ncbi:myosin heavy chain IB-like [Prinia subflava]|uniref:myosin heavy chain IB-like n=1 Tax=Prinia subflava TaxID=208062 RepID=UPI002FE1B820